MTYDSENFLPNHRTADKCCNNCNSYEPSYEGTGHCGILLRLREEKEDTDNDIWVFTSTSDSGVCDLWEKD